MNREKSGVRGQALVMVTVGLIAMCGMMGLAVDLGWSFFVEKQAQAAADAAALAAAQEAHSRLSSSAGFACPGSPSALTDVFCQPAIATCTQVAAGTHNNNLYNGCLYSQQNGFTDGGLSGAQVVRMQANSSAALPANAPGVGDIAYWVTVRATQSVPQLFSSIMGNTNGIVSASATAAIVSSIVPGSFYALNQAGDCIGTGAGFTVDCGVDVDLGGGSHTTCSGGDGKQHTICAANGIMLSSTCNGAAKAGCTTGGGGKGGGNTWAGQTSGSSSVWANSAAVQSGGQVNDTTAWTPPPAQSTDPLTTADPFQGVPQPPLQVPSGGGAIGSCAITENKGTATVTGNLGPYQYYAVNSSGVPTGSEIVLSGTVQFSSAGGCPGTLNSGATQNASFPAYMFYGGLQIGATIANFGPGQYVMVGTNTIGNNSFEMPSGNGVHTITGDSGAGTQFITTDLGYPNLSTQFSTLPAALTNGTVKLYQGSIALKGGNSTTAQLYGINNDNAPANLGDYNGSLFWQDRRNSTLISDVLGNVTSAPCFGGCASIPSALTTANNVTSTSPGFTYAAASQLHLAGTLYQPRGAWFSMQGGVDVNCNNPVNCPGLQIITGMILSQGSNTVSLLPSSRPIIKYRVALIK